MRWCQLVLLLAALATACSGPTPFVTAPPPLAPGAQNPGQRVSVCYNTLKTSPEKLQALAQPQCPVNTTAERLGTDYRLDDCPILTPGRATFVCKAAK